MAREMKTVLSIAGSDPSGGAGLQADLKTFAAHGVFGMAVVTCLTAQNTSRVAAVYPVAAAAVAEQIDAVAEDIDIDAVKVGLLPDAEVARAVAQALERYRPRHVVLDPVMVATSGDALQGADALAVMRGPLLGLARVVTPNLPEAETLSGARIDYDSPESQREACRAIAALGAGCVLLKGGHGRGRAVDLLFDGERFHEFSAARLPGGPIHGTGCTFSSAIAARLALGHGVVDAVRLAKEYITANIQTAQCIGKGARCLPHLRTDEALAKIR